MSDINILDPKETPFLTLRRVSRDGISRAVSSETVEFHADVEKGTFYVSSGKTQVKFGRNRERKMERQISEWPNEINNYMARGFEFVTDKKTERHEFHVVGEFRAIANRIMAKFIEQIVAANDEKMKQDYTKSVDEIPKECIDKANDILIQMQGELANETFTVQSFNAYLKDLFTQLPLAVSKHDGYFISVLDYESMASTISTLQEKLDTIMQQVQSFMDEKAAYEKGDDSFRKTILEANGLEMRDATPKEKENILEYMSDQKQNFVRAWKVTNFATEKRFQEYCDARNCTEENGGISHLWHGTGFENIWSIFKAGLYLNPALIKAGVRICGKAFGYGIYFAPYCLKSMGYTSSCSAMHRGGSGGRGGYLLLFKVATGNPYYYYRGTDKKGRALKKHYRPNHWEDFHKEIPDCDVLWAEAGQEGDELVRRLCYDEVIAYQEAQATIEYVVEFSDISW